MPRDGHLRWGSHRGGRGRTSLCGLADGRGSAAGGLGQEQHRPRRGIQRPGIGDEGGSILMPIRIAVCMACYMPIRKSVDMTDCMAVRINELTNGHINGHTNSDTNGHQNGTTSHHRPIVKKLRRTAERNATTRQYVLLPLSAHKED